MASQKPPAAQRLTRRSMLQAGGAATATGLLGLTPAAAAATTGMPVRGGGPEVYSRLGVEPFINCTSTYTINGGSRQLPEVIEAIEQAGHYHVNLDELMAKAGARIAELLGAESAMVSSGAAGSVTCGTIACVAGGDPEKMKQLPNTAGLKNECIVPKWSRSYYDQAVRNVGVRMIEVETAEDLAAAFSPRTALAHAQVNVADSGNPFSLRQYVQACHAHGVPVLIDAAADLPLRPNPFLEAGVDLVAYSGGKILRGPQTSGILMGRRDLIAAAYAGSSPHITFGRTIKVSKEEVVGLVTAVEYLVQKRDRDAEDREWTSWFEHIKARIEQVPGVKAEITPPDRPAYYPVLFVEWDPAKIGYSNAELGREMLAGSPRIMTHAEGEGHRFVLRPAAMYPGEYKIVAERLYEVLKNAPGPKPEPKRRPAGVDVSGHWVAELEFVASRTQMRLYLDADGNEISGSYSSPLVPHGTLRGHVDGDRVAFQIRGRYEATDFDYKFEGAATQNELGGIVELGWEYGQAKWSARRA
ncbi:MAG: aminotransferase class V-fold PLP-dependent enzyme [Acidobacteria bacterium]|nr:aminotransferase class V-fold PLP-dependent enzyme [Acidobacteriota bacterium]